MLGLFTFIMHMCCVCSKFDALNVSNPILYFYYQKFNLFLSFSVFVKVEQ